MIFRSIFLASNQRDVPVVAAFCPIVDDGIFPQLRGPPPHPNTNDDIEQSPSQCRITIEDDLLEQLNGDSIRSDTSAPASWAEPLAACSQATAQNSRLRELRIDYLIEDG